MSKKHPHRTGKSSFGGPDQIRPWASGSPLPPMSNIFVRTAEKLASGFDGVSRSTLFTSPAVSIGRLFSILYIKDTIAKKNEFRYFPHPFQSFAQLRSWSELSRLAYIKGNNPPSSFFSKTLSIIFTIQFCILFSETLIIFETKSWVSQNNLKYKSEFEWTVLNGMAPANHIQAAASWLVTAAQPTKYYPPPGFEFLSQLRIPS